MSGVSGLLNIAKSAILAQQAGMNVVSHNIANANTEGYSKQELTLGSRPGIKNSAYSIGQGVDAMEVRQRQAAFIDKRIQSELTNLGKWETSRRVLEQVETIFTGVGESDLNVAMNNFFNAWEDVSSNPESLEFRGQVVQQGKALTDKFHEMAEGFTEIRDNLNAEVDGAITNINRTFRKIWDLNRTIEEAESTGNTANDLRDQRNLLLKEVSTLINVEVQTTNQGGIQISSGGTMLLDRSNLVELTTQTVSEGGLSTTRVYAGNKELNVQGGELGGLLQVRDSTLTDYQSKLDTLANAMVTNINREHEKGFGLDGSTGQEFFTSTRISASDIELSTTILENQDKIATAAGEHDWVNDIHTSNGPGDNSIARQIAGLRNIKILSDRTSTFESYYNTMYSEVGFDTIDAKQNQENHQLLTDQLKNYRDSAVGVSIDEEMADIMKFQHSYVAAAQLISVANQMMDTLVNLLG